MGKISSKSWLDNDTVDLLHKSKIRKNPTPPKLRFVSPPRLRGGVLGTFARSLVAAWIFIT